METSATIRRIFAAALITLTCQAASAVDSVEFCNLRNDIRQISPFATLFRLKSYLSDKHVVFVTGVLESTKNEFVANASAITAVDSSVPITKIAPPRKQSIDANVTFLISEIKKANAKYPGRRILLLGMSKAGAEVTQLAAEYPEIFDDANPHGFVVDAVVPMNAAVGGSVFADIELNVDQSLTERWENFKNKNGFKENFFEQWISRVLKYFFLDTSSPGFKSLTSTASRRRTESLIQQLHPTNELKLRDKIFFVTTSRDGSDGNDAPSFMAPVIKFLASEGLANDGVLFEKDQVIPGLGQHLVSVRKASHFSLTGQFGPDSCRQDFTWYLMLRLARATRHSPKW